MHPLIFLFRQGCLILKSFLIEELQKPCRNPPYHHRTYCSKHISAATLFLQLFVSNCVCWRSCLILLLDKPLKIPYAGKIRFRHFKITMKLASLQDRICAIADNVYIQPGLRFPLPQCGIDLCSDFLRAVRNRITLPGLGGEILYSFIKSF